MDPKAKDLDPKDKDLDFGLKTKAKDHHYCCQCNQPTNLLVIMLVLDGCTLSVELWNVR